MSEWLNLVLRWLHVVVGVFWIGQTALFAWLDTRMRLEATAEGRGEVWMVHSGGFYRVDQERQPAEMPELLHWFRWEAALTWLSGFLLLVVVYYLGGVLVDPLGPVSRGAGVAVSVGALVGGWILYDRLWASPLGRRPILAAGLSLGLLLAAAWALGLALSPRAVYIHAGAIMGTVMAANVWIRILPAQRRMVAALRQGEPPPLAPAQEARRRSRHNTFMAIPVIFLMVSHHFPTAAYGHRHPILMLALFLGVGMAARGALNAWERR